MHLAISITNADCKVQAEPRLSAECEAVLKKNAIGKRKVLKQLRRKTSKRLPYKKSEWRCAYERI